MGRWKLAILSVVVVAPLLGCAGKPKSELSPEQESVQDSISAHADDVSDCYSAALKRNPKLNGKLVLDWSVGASGEAKDVKVIRGVESKLDQCIAGKVPTWSFAPPPDGKIAKIRYPFVLSPVEDPVQAVKSKSFETVAAPPPSNFKKCPQIEAEYAELCVRDQDNGECVLNTRQMSDLLKLVRTSPNLQSSYLAELDRMLKNPKASRKEGEALVAQLGEDCWSEIHVRVWKSVFNTLKQVPNHPAKSEAWDLLGERAFGLEVPTPTLLGLTRDLAILQAAADNGFLKLSGAAKKDFVFIQSKARSLRKSLNKDWGVNADGDAAVDVSAADPAKVVALARKELKAVKPLRAKLKEWGRKYWKKL